ncbi:MAG: alpha-2-macroglobulin, partial [Bacteroidota bacterium]|nr:alpha-2-macroglobulin [Bacteroidota bacterium]
SHNGKESKAAPGYKVTVYLRDANYQLKDSLVLTSNEFGSFTGNFQLPQNLLNGLFTITDKETRSAASFSVEEYKRPKFYVEFKKVKETYKVGDSVTIEGQANAYAGNVVDGAKVSYRVVREPRFIYPWRMRSWWFPQSPPMEIAHGETTTDQNGIYKISFPAIPDLKIDKKLEPVFDYRIYADVTDINGETRSTETVVSAGYKSLVLQLEVPERVIADSLKNLVVRTENMNREFQKAKVTISVSKLIPEQRLIRNRYWKQPDQFVFTKEEYIRLFPHDEYKDETNKETWAKGEIVYTITDSSRSNYVFPLLSASLLPGHYAIEANTKDKEGNEVKDVKYFEVYHLQKPSLTKPEYLWAINKNASIEPGEKISVLIGSSASNVYLVQEIDKTKSDQGKEQREQKILSLNNSIQNIDFTAKEEDRGGYGVSYFFIKDNRLHQFNDVIDVPWSNKNLDIEFATFRDKTLPGSEEKWKVRITGNTKDKVAAEMLASMYDASLDQFKIHNWSKPSIWPVYRTIGLWQGNANFSSVNALQKWIDNEYRNFEKIYDHFFFAYHHRIYHQTRSLQGRVDGVEVMSDMSSQEKAIAPGAPSEREQAANGAMSVDTTISPLTNAIDNFVQVRRNFIETAFFFPQLHTDKDGNIEFTFTAPEDLTKWKLQTLSHTKDLAFGLAQKEIVTQKELMVQPNMPRFLRQG